MLVGYLMTEFWICGVVSTSSSSVVIQSQGHHEIGYHALIQQGGHFMSNVPICVYWCSIQ